MFLSLFGENVLTAAYLINKAPLVLLSNNTPYTVLFNKTVDYGFIKTFGCLTYASTPTVNRNKFDPRARPCVFMGYPLRIKGYKLYDMTNMKFFISRDVLFFEERFPFQSIKEDNKHISHDFIDQFVIPSPLFDHLENKGITKNLVDNTLESLYEDCWV